MKTNLQASTRRVGDEEIRDAAVLIALADAQIFDDSPKMKRRSRDRLPPQKPSATLFDRGAVCFLLCAMVWFVFGQTLGFEFVGYDDPSYVSENPHVSGGLTWTGIAWAFTHFHSSNWHPITWISHMLDCQLYGLRAGGHHLTNVLLQALAACLLFVGLQKTTGTFWRSAFAAGVFAIHPLRVESVAWIAERKDLLAGVFFLLTLGAYVFYARRPWSWRRYGAVAALFGLGLMAKPMLVTLPLVLLLLDFWPLRRVRFDSVSGLAGEMRSTIQRVLVEKIPLLAMAGASCLVTLAAQQGVIGSLGRFSIPLRLTNATESVAIYLGQLFYPAGLAVFYPYPAGGIRWLQAGFALFLLLAISVATWLMRRKHPYLLVGWLWYLVMLFPVIGIVQVGDQAHANRYTYLPQIGLVVALTWLVADLSATWRHRSWICGLGGALVLSVLMAQGRHETSFWRNSDLLWEHALDCTTDNPVALNNIAWRLAAHPDAAKRNGVRAIVLSQKAIELTAFSNYLMLDTSAAAYAETGNFPEAIRRVEAALQMATAKGHREDAAMIKSHLQFFQMGMPARDPGLLPFVAP